MKVMFSSVAVNRQPEVEDIHNSVFEYPMKYGVITLATSKGGAGKSTLARALAAHWHGIGLHPALIDADPQRGLAARHNPHGLLGKVPLHEEPEERVGDLIEDLKARHRPVIVDTAGFRNRTAVAALVSSDLALIPLKPSAEDAEGAMATFDLINELNATPERAGRPVTIAMVLTMTLRSTLIARHVRRQLEDAQMPLLQAEMAHRVSYPEAGIEGLSPSVVDPDGAAARDIAAIVHEIMKLGKAKARSSSTAGA